MTGPEVTIIIPCYHAEKFIKRALDSIENQTFQDYEIIMVIDDFHADSTFEIIASHPLSIKTRLLTSETKSSPAKARNRAIKEARGRYIAFLDADDEWRPPHLENAMEHFTTHPETDVYYAQCVEYEGDIPRKFHGDKIENLNKFCPAPHSSIVCRNPPPAIFDERLIAADDYMWLFDLKKAGAKFHFNPRIEVYYHIHNGNLTGGARGLMRQMYQVYWYAKNPDVNCLKPTCLSMVQVEPTTRCGQKCKMCIRSPNQEIRDITIETLYKILIEHREAQLVKLQGLGEPFMHPRLNELAMMTRATGKYTCTITNGQPDTVVPWSKYFDEVMFSMDFINGPGPKDAHRVDMEKVISKIFEIKAEYPGVEVCANMVITAETTEDDIKEVETFCCENEMSLIKNHVANWHAKPEKHITEMVQKERDIYGKLRPYEPFCPWGFNEAYYDAHGRLHNCCVRMSDEYVIPGGWIGKTMQEFRRQRLEGCCENCRSCPD